MEEWLDLELDRDMYKGQVEVTLRMAYQNLHWLLEKSSDAASQIKSAMSKLEEAADVMHLEIEKPTCECLV